MPNKNSLDVIKIREKVQDKKEQLLKIGEKVPSDKELLREVVGEIIEESWGQMPLPPKVQQEERVVSSTPPPPPPSSVTQEDAERKIKELVDLALKEGISKAVSLLRKTGNSFLLDKFHDELTFRLENQKLEKN